MTDLNLPCLPARMGGADIITTKDIISTLSDGLLSQILISSIIMFFLQIACLKYIQEWDLPAWWNIDTKNKEQVRAKLFQTMIMISFVPSMYAPVIIILYKFGVFS